MERKTARIIVRCTQVQYGMLSVESKRMNISMSELILSRALQRDPRGVADARSVSVHDRAESSEIPPCNRTGEVEIVAPEPTSRQVFPPEAPFRENEAPAADYSEYNWAKPQWYITVETGPYWVVQQHKVARKNFFAVFPGTRKAELFHSHAEARSFIDRNESVA